jgi:hypothetical protein
VLEAAEILPPGARVLKQMNRRGVETRLVIPGERMAVSRSDPTVLRAVSRGYQWFAELALERVRSTKSSLLAKV